jgi:hypothetical protein
MATQSPTRGYPHVPGDVVADVPEAVNALADAIDADVDELFEDTGWIDVIPESQFTVGFEGARYRRRSNIVYVQVMIVRGPAWGGETVLLTLPVGFRPTYNHWMIANNEGRMIEVRVMSNGQLRSASASVPEKGGVLVFSGSFPID